MFPKRQHPVVTAILPSTGKPIKFRPMQAREEKILLRAKASGEDDEILSSVKQVVASCVLDPSFDADRTAIFDLEFLFVRIRVASVGNEVEVSYQDKNDGVQRDFVVDLDKVEVLRTPVEDKVDLGEGVVIQLRWPDAATYVRAAMGDDLDLSSELILSSVDKVYDKDVVVDAQKQPREELKEFVDSLELKDYHKIVEFVAATPRLNYEIKYQNDLGEERAIVLSRLSDFFSFA